MSDRYGDRSMFGSLLCVIESCQYLQDDACVIRDETELLKLFCCHYDEIISYHNFYRQLLDNYSESAMSKFLGRHISEGVIDNEKR